jgi:hypothetical protein
MDTCFTYHYRSLHAKPLDVVQKIALEVDLHHSRTLAAHRYVIRFRSRTIQRKNGLARCREPFS